MAEKKVALIGCGIIGAGLAVNAMSHGYKVGMRDINDDLLVVAKKRVADIFSIYVRNNVYTQAEADSFMANAYYTTSIAEAVKDACFIIESVPENMDIKHATYAEIEETCLDDAVIGSTTTAKMPSELQEGMKHPERLVVTHPYNPSFLLPLVELCAGKQTEEKYVQKAKEYLESMGKVAPICRKEVSGYIVNRLSWAASAEAKKSVAEGYCSVEDMDNAIKYGPGLRMAILGQLLAISQGVDGGYRNLNMKYYGKPATELDELYAQGVDEEIANRPAEIGNTVEGVNEYLYKMIIEILRLQNMI